MNHKGYSAERKLEILKRCFEETENIRDVTINKGIPRTIIYSWRKRYLSDGVFGLQHKKKQIKSTESIDEQKADDLRSNKVRSSAGSVSSDEIVKLQKQVQELQMKVDVLTEVFELLKKEQGTDIEALINREKFLIISAIKKKYSTLSLLRHLSMSKSSYYYIEKVNQKEDRYKDVRSLLKNIFSNNYECYGYKRLHTELKKAGHYTSETVVRRLMNEDGLEVVRCKKKRYSSYLGELSPAVQNIVNRNFSPSSPNEKWLTDISEFATSKGKLYLSVIRYCYNDEIIAYKIEISLQQLLWLTIHYLKPSKGCNLLVLSRLFVTTGDVITDGPDGYKLQKMEVLYDQCQRRAVVLIIMLVKDSLEE